MAVASRQDARQVQESFSAGMWRSGDPARIPANGFYDGTNLLLDLLGGAFKRGGSSYRSNAAFGAGLRLVWDGWLASGQTTILASTTEYGKESGGVVTALGHGGLTNPARPANYKGVLYLPGGVTYDGTTFGTAAKVTAFYAVAGNRLVAAEGRTVFFSKVGEPGTFGATEYVELPEGVEILGLVGMRESVAVFTTGGLYIIGGVALSVVDAAGNAQWRLDRYSGTILWGNGAAIAEWEGSLIVPGTSAIWLVKRGVSSEAIRSFARISNPIVDLYQEYVRQGYQPGQATVYGSHYVLPILGGGRVIDLLVGRLDLPDRQGNVPWTHMDGYGARLAAVTTRVSAGVSREPVLIGGTYGTDSRLLNLAYLTPGEGAATDADGSVPQWALETRSFSTGNLVPNLVTKLRVRYQMSSVAGGATFDAAVASDTPPAGSSLWGRFVWGVGTWASPGSASYEVLSGPAPESLDASKPHAWYPLRKRRTIRLRLTCSQAVSQLAIKTLELFVRQDGRL